MYKSIFDNFWVIFGLVLLVITLIVVWCALLYFAITWIVFTAFGITMPWYVTVLLVIIVDMILSAIVKIRKESN